MQTQVFGLYPCSFTNIMPSESGCHYDKVDDKAVFIFCAISQNWSCSSVIETEQKIKIYYYKHNRDIRNLSSLGLCTIFSC